ncbi:MAG: EamA family transporter [Actinomycetota bacterium]|nr:EamA family transporter [Actinomycetota bacterium]
MVAAALGFGSALCWGLADFLGGIRTRALTLAAVLLVSQLTGFAAIAAVVALADLEVPALADVAPALGAGVCQLVGIAALYRALSIGTMSLISPISASGAAAIPVAVGIATGERPGALQAAGMAAAFAGVVLATRAPASGAPTSSKGALPLAAIAALGFGGFYVGINAAVDDAEPFWALLAARSSAALVLIAVLVAIRPRLGAGRADLPALALIGLLDIAANACFTLGTETGLLSVVSVLASLYPVATVVLARALLGERLVAVQAAGVAVALAGVALIATG